MKTFLTLLVMLSTMSGAFAKDIKTPRLLKKPIAATNQPALRKVLEQLVTEYETVEKKGDLTFYGADEDESLCELAKSGKELNCKIDYLNDRWNGSVEATFAVRRGQVTLLKEISFDGSM